MESPWAPVRVLAARTLAGSAVAQVGDRAPERGVVAVVRPAGGCTLDVMPGLWDESSREHGLAQLVNASTKTQELERKAAWLPGSELAQEAR